MCAASRYGWMGTGARSRRLRACGPSAGVFGWCFRRCASCGTTGSWLALVGTGCAPAGSGKSHRTLSCPNDRLWPGGARRTGSGCRRIVSAGARLRTARAREPDLRQPDPLGTRRRSATSAVRPGVSSAAGRSGKIQCRLQERLERSQMWLQPAHRLSGGPARAWPWAQARSRCDVAVHRGYSSDRLGRGGLLGGPGRPGIPAGRCPGPGRRRQAVRPGPGCRRFVSRSGLETALSPAHGLSVIL